MTNNDRSDRTRKKSFKLNNRTLMVLVCVLAVTLFSLGLVACNIVAEDTTDPTETTAITEATEMTDPSTVPTQATEATNPTETTEATEATEPSETTAPTEPPETTPPTTAPTTPPASVTPQGGKYVDVGYGNIAEIIQINGETFDAKTTDDYSRPTNNYLPEGTMDYYKIVDGSGQYDYVLLRSGQRLYLKRKIYPPVEWPEVTKRYEGTLPDHNEINIAGFEVVDNHTVLTLDSMWKAPFYFDLKPQSYAYPNGGSDRDYSVSSVTATYVDITFCYATSLTGQISIGNNPVFKSAEIIKNESDYTLRLHLRKTGGFYGWNSYYNDKDQLCFEFLNPAKATATNTNPYGADLTGIEIFIDVGHGGIDGGAEGTDANGKTWIEEELNLKLSLVLKEKLEKTGATVIINRTDDTNMNTDQRVRGLLEAAPDICLAIHQNKYAADSRINGYVSMYFTPFSQPLSQKILSSVNESGVYKKVMTQWNPFYMIRQTVCPVVCLENGFMSNLEDLKGMSDDATVDRKAEAIAQGVADYFLSIN